MTLLGTMTAPEVVTLSSRRRLLPFKSPPYLPSPLNPCFTLSMTLSIPLPLLSLFPSRRRLLSLPFFLHSPHFLCPPLLFPSPLCFPPLSCPFRPILPYLFHSTFHLLTPFLALSFFFLSHPSLSSSFLLPTLLDPNHYIFPFLPFFLLTH